MDTNGNYIQNQFCSYEIAVALKELGFDEKCITKFDIQNNKPILYPVLATLSLNDPYDFEYNGYDQKIINDTEHHWNFTGYKNSVKDHNNDVISAPLWQQAIDWFREKYDITIDIAKIYNGTDNYHFALNLEWEYFEGTYYEAREQAILKAIELCQKEK